MDFSTLSSAWPIIVSVITFVATVGVLFYRVRAAEIRMDKMEQVFEANLDRLVTQDRSDHQMMLSKVEMLEGSIHRLELTVTTAYVPKDEFVRVMTRIEDKLDKLMAK